MECHPNKPKMELNIKQEKKEKSRTQPRQGERARTNKVASPGAIVMSTRIVTGVFKFLLSHSV
jgi:hypothetical protein